MAVDAVLAALSDVLVAECATEVEFELEFGLSEAQLLGLAPLPELPSTVPEEPARPSLEEQIAAGRRSLRRARSASPPARRDAVDAAASESGLKLILLLRLSPGAQQLETDLLVVPLLVIPLLALILVDILVHVLLPHLPLLFELRLRLQDALAQRAQRSSSYEAAFGREPEPSPRARPVARTAALPARAPDALTPTPYGSLCTDTIVVKH